MINFVSNSPKQTVELGRQIGRLLDAGSVVALFGDLGSGKTTLIKGIALALGIKQAEVSSPTFILIREYPGKLPLYHFDLYRLEKQAQIENLGYQEYFYSNGICVIEWAQKLGGLLPKEYIRIELSHQAKNRRGFNISRVGNKHKKLISNLAKLLK